MTDSKKIGIWIDNNSINLMEFSKDSFGNTITVLEFPLMLKQLNLLKSKNIDQDKQPYSVSFKELGSVIEKYNDVILFGPTAVNEELIKLIRIDMRFNKIKIEAMQTEKITEKQQHSFVREYFRNRL